MAGEIDYNEKKKASRKSIRYGAIISGVLIVLFLLYYYVFNTGFEQGFIGFIPSLVFILSIIVCQNSYSRQLHGEITFGDLFATGFKVAAVAVCIYLLFLILFILLEPSYKIQTLEFMEAGKQQVLDMGISEEQFNTRLDKMKDHFLTTTIANSVMNQLIVGVIASLIGALFSPKKRKTQLSNF